MIELKNIKMSYSEVIKSAWNKIVTGGDYKTVGISTKGKVKANISREIKILVRIWKLSETMSPAIQHFYLLDK